MFEPPKLEKKLPKTAAFGKKKIAAFIGGEINT
jgi:hypothetical protein